MGIFDHGWLSPNTGAVTPQATPSQWELELAAVLHINYCADLVFDGTPWEVAAEPEPRYFETLKDATVFLVNLPAEPEGASPTSLAALTQRSNAASKIDMVEISSQPPPAVIWVSPDFDDSLMLVPEKSGEPEGAETAPMDEAFRNELAKVLWEHSIAEEGPRVHGKDWAPWPDDAIRQPYCKSTFRRADAIIKFLRGRQG